MALEADGVELISLAVYKVLRRNTGGNETLNNVIQGLSDAVGA